MSALTGEELRKRVAEILNVRTKEFRKIVVNINENFRNLGLESAVWCPDKIHSANIGGIDADSYIGYSRVEGKWGLIVRTIERDCDSHIFVSQRVRPIESCRDVEMVVNALKNAGVFPKIPDLSK